MLNAFRQCEAAAASAQKSRAVSLAGFALFERSQ
jgi:hypothetical protein